MVKLYGASGGYGFLFLRAMSQVRMPAYTFDECHEGQILRCLQRGEGVQGDAGNKFSGGIREDMID